jgi:hypothetical protein
MLIPRVCRRGDSDPGLSAVSAGSLEYVFQVRSIVLLADFSHCREGVRLAPHKEIARADSSCFQRLTGSCRKPPNAEDDQHLMMLQAATTLHQSLIPDQANLTVAHAREPAIPAVTFGVRQHSRPRLSGACMVTRFSQFLTGAESWLPNLAWNAVSEGAAMFCSTEYTAMTDSRKLAHGPASSAFSPRRSAL